MHPDSDAPRKRRRVEGPLEVPSVTELEWNQFEADVSTFEAQHVLVKTKLAFSFVEGPLVRAVRAGHWWAIPSF
jgi:midasin